MYYSNLGSLKPGKLLAVDRSAMLGLVKTLHQRRSSGENWYKKPVAPRSKSRKDKGCCKLPKDCQVDTSALKMLVNKGNALENMMKVQGMIHARQDELVELQREISHLKGQLDYDEAMNTNLKSQLISLLQEIQSRESMFAKKGKNHAVIIEKRREKIMDVDQEIVRHDLIRDSLQQKVSLNTSAVTELLTKISMIQLPVGVEESISNHIKHEDERRNEQEGYLREAELQKFHLQSRITQLREDLGHYHHLSDELSDSLDYQNSHISQLKSTLSTREATKQHLSESSTLTQLSLSSTADQASSANHTASQLARDLATLKSAICSLSSDISSLGSSLTSKRKHLAAAESANQASKQERDRCCRELLRLQTTIADVRYIAYLRVLLSARLASPHSTNGSSEYNTPSNGLSNPMEEYRT
jgi:chromosome segregation ATPase